MSNVTPINQHVHRRAWAESEQRVLTYYEMTKVVEDLQRENFVAKSEIDRHIKGKFWLGTVLAVLLLTAIAILIWEAT